MQLQSQESDRCSAMDSRFLEPVRFLHKISPVIRKRTYGVNITPLHHSPDHVTM